MKFKILLHALIICALMPQAAFAASADRESEAVSSEEPAAAEVSAEEDAFAVEPQDIVFHTTGGGKYLYNNNPEGIDDSMVAAGDDPRYISNHDGLEPDTYYLYMSYFNYTGSGKRGYDIEVDVQITAKEDAVFTIENASFETIDVFAYEENGTVYHSMPEWQFNGVCADMLGVPIIDKRGTNEYIPHDYEPVTVRLKAGETVWLSEYFENYDVVHFADPVHFQALIEMESGVVDMDTAALPHNGILGDRSDVPEDIGFGIYRYDYTVKGIADTLPKVETDVLEYEIDDTHPDGTILPGTVYNQYSPDGLTVDTWCSNINPVSDYWSKYTAVESDMIKLEYEDDNKLTYYGKNVKDKDNIWRFDTRHTSVSEYTALSGKSRDDYSPNFEVEDIFLEGIEPAACNLGNYGVIETYNLEITNNGNEDRYFEYNIMTKSDVIVYAADEDGSFDKAYCKGITDEAVYTPMASVLLPAGETTRFSVNMFIPVNVNGGIQNRFVISDSSNMDIKPQEERSYVDPLRGQNLSEVKDKLGKTALEEFSANLDSYEINDGEGIHLVRWCAWDGAPYFYANSWGYCNKVYVLDEDYEIVHTFTVPSMATESDISAGVLYVRDLQNGIYSSSDGGASWKVAFLNEIPVNTDFVRNVGEIDTVVLTAADGTREAYKIDLAEYKDYIESFDMKQNTGETFDDRKYTSMIINGKYSVGNGMMLGSKIYIAKNDKWIMNEVSNRIFEQKTASEWASEYIDRACGYGIVPLYMKSDEKAFTEPLTRLEFCDLIYEMLECMDAVPAPADSRFTDCSDRHVLSLVTAGIITGISDTEFAPQSGITREQAAAVLARTAAYMKSEPEKTAVEIKDTVSDWAKECVYMMYNSGIMNGVGDGNFDAYGSYTKEQSITAQVRLYEYLLCADAYNRLPALPNGTKYYAVYREKFRDGRIELTTFDTSDGSVPKLISGESLTIENESVYTDDKKYYLSCGEWVPFEKDYIRISNMSGGLIITNVAY